MLVIWTIFARFKPVPARLVNCAWSQKQILGCKEPTHPACALGSIIFQLMLPRTEFL